MPGFHPGLDLLTEHVAGNLPLAQAACVSVHLHYCEQCQRASCQLQNCAAAIFERLDGAPVGDAMLDAVLARLDEAAPLTYPRSARPPVGEFPVILQRLMSGNFKELPWKRITRGLRISYLSTGDTGHEFALYQIKAGGSIPEHTHRGSEITLVLEGEISDANGVYQQGDFLLRQPGDVHAPTATQSGDCICLAVLDAPLQFTDWKYRWLNPALQLRTG